MFWKLSVLQPGENDTVLPKIPEYFVFLLRKKGEDRALNKTKTGPKGWRSWSDQEEATVALQSFLTAWERESWNIQAVDNKSHKKD